MLVAVVPIEVLPRVEVRAAHRTVEFVSMSHDATPVAKYDVIAAQTALAWWPSIEKGRLSRGNLQAAFANDGCVWRMRLKLDTFCHELVKACWWFSDG